MNFSKRFKNTSTPVFSPCAKMVSAANGAKVIIHDVETLQMVQTWVCCGPVREVVWSPDSKYIASVSGNKIQLWSMSDSTWRSTIPDTDDGVEQVVFSPCGRYLLLLHEFSLLLTIWSLEFATQMFIKNPKGSLFKFSKSEKYLAVIERSECNDWMVIFDTKSWKLINHFKLPTVDAAGFEWGPSSSEVCVWDHAFEHQLYIYYLDGTLAFTHEVTNPISMGLQVVSWSPSGQYLAVGTHTHTVYILNTSNGKVSGELKIPESVSGCAVQYYREQRGILAGTTIAEKLQAQPEHKFEVVSEEMIEMKFDEIVTEKKSSNKTATKGGKERRPRRYGVTSVKWSHDNTHLAAMDSSLPLIVTVWNIPSNGLTAVLELTCAVKTFNWHPSLLRLILASGDSSLCMWESDGSWIIQLPSQCSVNVMSSSWASDGNAVTLASKDSYCIGYLE